MGGERHDPDPADTPARGFVSDEVAAEFPGVGLWWTAVALGSAARMLGARPSPPALRRRLRLLSDRYRGDRVVAMRTHAVPHAYRSFFRQIGLDPDVQHVPAERVAVQRLVHGGLRSRGLVADACLVALVETGVGVWALDAACVDAAGLGIAVAGASGAGLRIGVPGASGAAGAAVAPGSLVVADGSRAHAVLFDDPLPGSRVGLRTRRAALYAVGVPGVPDIHLEEALWTARELLGEDPDGC